MPHVPRFVTLFLINEWTWCSFLRLLEVNWLLKLLSQSLDLSFGCKNWLDFRRLRLCLLSRSRSLISLLRWPQNTSWIVIIRSLTLLCFSDLHHWRLLVINLVLSLNAGHIRFQFEFLLLFRLFFYCYLIRLLINACHLLRHNWIILLLAKLTVLILDRFILLPQHWRKCHRVTQDSSCLVYILRIFDECITVSVISVRLLLCFPCFFSFLRVLFLFFLWFYNELLIVFFINLLLWAFSFRL